MRAGARVLRVLLALLALAVSQVGCASLRAGGENDARPVRKSG